jgi:vesicle-fusing ATPase
LRPGTIGTSAFQRQWIGLSASGDEVDVRPLDLSSNDYLTSLDVEIGFWKRGQEATEQYDSEEMARNFIKAFNGQVFAVGQIIVFDFHGLNLKGTIKGVQLVDMSDKRGGGGSMGVLMTKSDITFVKAADSAIKIRASSKR